MEGKNPVFLEILAFITIKEVNELASKIRVGKF